MQFLLCQKLFSFYKNRVQRSGEETVSLLSKGILHYNLNKNKVCVYENGI